MVERAIPTFDKACPRQIGVFAFDNSSGHTCKADDALVANRMNMGPGGKQLQMHNTILPKGTEQSMVFRQTDYQWGSNLLIAEDLVGKPKGMKRTLQERGLWQEGLKKQCGKAKKEEQETEQHYQARPEID